jgi:hypothetical protein
MDNSFQVEIYGRNPEKTKETVGVELKNDKKILFTELLGLACKNLKVVDTLDYSDVRLNGMKIGGSEKCVVDVDRHLSVFDCCCDKSVYESNPIVEFHIVQKDANNSSNSSNFDYDSSKDKSIDNSTNDKNNSKDIEGLTIESHVVQKDAIDNVISGSNSSNFENDSGKVKSIDNSDSANDNNNIKDMRDPLTTEPQVSNNSSNNDTNSNNNNTNNKADLVQKDNNSNSTNRNVGNIGNTITTESHVGNNSVNNNSKDISTIVDIHISTLTLKVNKLEPTQAPLDNIKSHFTL